MTHFKILFQLLFWKMQHMFKGRSPTFSFTTSNKECISLSPKTAFELWWMLSLLIRLTLIWCSEHQYNNTCSNNDCLGEDTILHRTNTRWSFHSPCYWNMWVSSFSFWFILDNLCTNHYHHASSMVFFSPWMFVSHYWQCVSITLQRMQTLAILQ
jgi:hypothetical protein